VGCYSAAHDKPRPRTTIFPATHPARPPELLAPAGVGMCEAAVRNNGAGMQSTWTSIEGSTLARGAGDFAGLGDAAPFDCKCWRGPRASGGTWTLNTLDFPNGNAITFVRSCEAIALAGVDAVFGSKDLRFVARIVRAMCEGTEIHASTQMSLTSAENVQAPRTRAVPRSFLARKKLSIGENSAKSVEAISVPLGVVHSRSVVACLFGPIALTNEILGRTAVRTEGKCAQACRLRMKLVCDGEPPGPSADAARPVRSFKDSRWVWVSAIPAR